MTQTGSTASTPTPLGVPSILGQSECLWPAGATLGEGTLWSPRERALYWIDILESRLYRLDPASGERRNWQVKEERTTLAERTDAQAQRPLLGRDRSGRLP